MLISGFLTLILPMFLFWKFCFLCQLLFRCFTPQSTIFQPCWDDFLSISSKQRIKYLAQGHNTATPSATSLELASLLFPVWRSTNWATLLQGIYLTVFQNIASMKANVMNPDQTAPEGAVWSGSILFAI